MKMEKYISECCRSEGNADTSNNHGSIEPKGSICIVYTDAYDCEQLPYNNCCEGPTPGDLCSSEIERTLDNLQTLGSGSTCACSNKAIEDDLKRILLKLKKIKGPRPCAKRNSCSKPTACCSCPPSCDVPLFTPHLTDTTPAEVSGQANTITTITEPSKTKQPAKATGQANITEQSKTKQQPKYLSNYKGDQKGVISIDEYEKNKKKKKKTKSLNTECSIPMNEQIGQVKQKSIMKRFCCKRKVPISAPTSQGPNSRKPCICISEAIGNILKTDTSKWRTGTVSSGGKTR